LLEKMLVKWAIEGRRKSSKIKPFKDKDEQYGRGAQHASTSAANLSVKDLIRSPDSQAESTETIAQVLTASLDRLKYQRDATFTKTTEDEGDRAMRRIDAEERDTKLRDEKLLSLVRPQVMRHNQFQGQDHDFSMPLTEENMEKLSHEQDGDSCAPQKEGSVDQESMNFSSTVDQPPSRSESRTQA